ncbi:cyclic nucleotide-gated ion channel 1-like isoform X2 [Rosa chinensis]|nr:cyclic nucleotide-gated ion channel 1-like isoform X2 [Rosa chinensis]XP_040362263.1 cyclic nucleotide-gated ion channel 1-like isoform X2 [Rosa chinensis]
MRRAYWSMSATTSMKLTVVLLCIGVLLDPYFFYIPIIDETNMCLGVDKKLMTAALVSRSLTDIPLVIKFIIGPMSYWPQYVSVYNDDSEALPNAQPSEGFKRKLKKFVKAITAVLLLIVTVISILPIPQVAIVLVFPNMEGSRYFYKLAFLNALLLLQYMCRVYLIHQLIHHLQYFIRKGVTATFNFFLYILAGHVLGALWYFYSIQQEISCWHQACPDTTSQCISTYRCDSSITYTSIAFRKESCPTNLPDITPFNFGIFQDVIQSGNTRLKNFPTKYFYCFSWGLRNLSNFGTNLETSSSVWENCFALLISIIGLLLFLYLIGNVQLYLQSNANQTTTFEQEEKDKKLLRHAYKLLQVERNIREWMARNRIPEEMIMTDIMKNVKQKSEEHDYIYEEGDVNLKHITSNLPWYLRKRVQRHLCMDALHKVPMLENMEEKVLKMICEYLRPMIYHKYQDIVEAGAPLDVMFLVIEGTVICTDYASTHAATQLQKGYFLGEELLTWASLSDPDRDRPTSTKNVCCETEVEAFILTIEDLMNLVSTSQFQRNLKHNYELHIQERKQLALAYLKTDEEIRKDV